MKRKLLLLALMAGTCAFSLLSCRARPEFSGGKALSTEETQALLTSLQEAPSVDATEQEKMYYFVTGSGAVYHSDASCAHLKNSKNVQTGTLSRVLDAGKERLCASCAKKEAGAQTEAATEDTQVCYYTAGGTVWHCDSSCASLSRSKNVLEGTVSEAMLSGKTRPCTRCGE